MLFGGCTKVVQKCDGLAERVGGTDAKGGYFRKWHSREGGQRVYQEYTFLRNGFLGEDVVNCPHQSPLTASTTTRLRSNAHKLLEKEVVF